MTVRHAAALFLAASIAGAPAQAQPGGSEIRFSGLARLETQYDGITGADQYRPRWITTLSLTPVLAFSGLSVSAPIMLSSLETGDRQPYDRMTLHIGPDFLAAHPVDWLNLDLYDTYPRFTDQTLGGTLVRGASVDLRPGWLHVRGAAGRSRRAVAGSGGVDPAFAQDLYAGSIGFGRDTGVVFVNIDAVHIRDAYDPAVVTMIATPRDSGATFDSVESIRPQDNTVAALELGMNLFDRALAVRAEIDGSTLSRDTRSGTFAVAGVPAFLAPRLSSQYGYAWAAAATWNGTNTHAAATVRSTSAGYAALAVPGLQTDLLRIAGDVNQQLFDHRLVLSCAASRENNNLSGLRLGTSTIFIASPAVVVAVPSWPTVMASYTMIDQGNDAPADSAALRARTAMLNATATTGFRLFDRSHTLTAGVSTNAFHPRDAWASAADFDVVTLNLLLSHGISEALSANWGGSLSRTSHAAGAADELVTLLVGGEGRMFASALALGGTFSFMSGTSAGVRSHTARFSCHGTYRWPHVADVGCALDLVSHGVAAAAPLGYRETMARISLSKSW